MVYQSAVNAAGRDPSQRSPQEQEIIIQALERAVLSKNQTIELLAAELEAKDGEIDALRNALRRVRKAGAVTARPATAKLSSSARYHTDSSRIEDYEGDQWSVRYRTINMELKNAYFWVRVGLWDEVWAILAEQSMNNQCLPCDQISFSLFF